MYNILKYNYDNRVSPINLSKSSFVQSNHSLALVIYILKQLAIFGNRHIHAQKNIFAA